MAFVNDRAGAIYPMLLRPALKDYIWGGTRLCGSYGFESDKPRVAEAWTLSCHRDGESIVANGRYAGLRLTEALELIGEKPLPILVKLIDAADRLSMQVHPDDEYAQAHEGEAGKNEMWYVIDAEEGATLICGFEGTVSRDEVCKHISAGTLESVVCRVPVHPGDVFYIPAGTLHAIGAGILIAEVQQNSNSTYRVYDYGRVGSDGKPRALHIEKALDVLKLERTASTPVYKTCRAPYGTRRVLIDCRYFKSEMISLNGKICAKTRDNFLGVMLLSGSATLSSNDTVLKLKKGSSVYIPRGLEYSFEGTAELFVTSHLGRDGY